MSNSSSMAYDTLAGDDAIAATIAALLPRGVTAVVVATKEEALAKIKELIPAGASVNNGSSRTLEEVGLVEYLKAGQHGWNNLHALALAETDPAQQAQLRQQAYFADYYMGSVHALAETGEMVIASNSASQLPPIVATSKNLIFVVGAQKITPTYAEAMDRLWTYVVPLEDARMKSVGMGGTMVSKILTFEKEPAYTGRTIHMIIVKEKLGF